MLRDTLVAKARKDSLKEIQRRAAVIHKGQRTASLKENPKGQKKDCLIEGNPKGQLAARRKTFQSWRNPLAA